MRDPQLFPRRILPLVLALIVSAGPAFPVAKEIIQIQRDMAILQEQIRQLERRTGERMAVLENLIKQALDAEKKLNAAIAVIDRSVAKQEDAVVGPVTSISSRVDSLAGQLGGLRDAVEELNSRLGKVQQQVEDVKNHLTTLPPPYMGGEEVTDGGATSAETLYSSAMIDYQRGNYDLARAQFSQYLKLYGQTVRASEAQYHLGDIAYREGNYAEAVEHFDTVLERFPVGSISADAQFKKGLAMLKLEKSEEAAREFRSLLEKYPNSNVAPNARAQLNDLEGNPKPSPGRRSR